MRLYWDLAMRLLWGSRLNASTRMTALLAFGILFSTAFGVIVVGMVNKGFSAILNAEAVRMRAAPENQVVFTSPLRARDPNRATAQAKIAEASRQFSKALGPRAMPDWNFHSALFLLVPENQVPVLMLAKHKRDQGQAAMPELPSEATKRQVEVQEESRAKIDQQMELDLAGARVLSGYLCSAKGIGPSRIDEIWVQRSWGQMGQAVASSWVAMLVDGYSSPDTTKRMPLHRKFRVVKLAPLSMRAVNCSAWVSPRFMEVVHHRHPERVSRTIAWSGPGLPMMEEKWFGDDGAFRFGPKKQGWVFGSIASRSSFMDREQNMRAAEKVLSVQRLVSWMVVGMMAALAIYQVCSLMMMLGLHFRFDVAMLRSLGMSRWRVMLVFVVSSLAIMGLGLGVGMTAAWWWLPHMNDHLGSLLGALDAKGMVEWIPWVFDRKFAWHAFSSGMILGLVAGLIPAFMASRARPSDIWKAET